MPAVPVGAFTRSLRLARLALHVLRGLAIVAFIFPFISEARHRRHVERWSRQLLAVLKIRLHVHRERTHAATAPFMIVANHISWVDVFVIDAVMPARFVAKAEIERWPLLGWLSARTGTVFIHRARRRDTARINERITAALRAHAVMAVFPEGTTSDGSRVLHFHSSLLQPAVAAPATVQPVALRYLRADGSRCTEVAYDGGTLWDCVRSMMTQPVIHAELIALEPLMPHDHRRALAHAAREAIVHALATRPAGRTRSERSAGPRAAAQ